MATQGLPAAGAGVVGANEEEGAGGAGAVLLAPGGAGVGVPAGPLEGGMPVGRLMAVMWPPTAPAAPGGGLTDASTVAPGRRLVDALGLPGGGTGGGVLAGPVAVMVTVGADDGVR